MNMMTKTTTPIDFQAIKAKQNAAWSSGDYRKIGVTLQITGEALAEAADLKPGSAVLDVAAGNGNASLAFARRRCGVMSTDYVPALLEGGRARAKAEGLDVGFQVADAESLPFDDGQFDAVVSSFGVMFTPNQEKAASELKRVCRSNGTIALANWTPQGFIGALFRTIGRHVAPPAGVQSPTLWGDAAWIEQTFGPDARSIRFKKTMFMFRYPSPQDFVDFFRTYYGPMHKAFLALDKSGRQALSDDALETIDRFNQAHDGSMAVPSEYAEIIMTRA